MTIKVHVVVDLVATRLRSPIDATAGRFTDCGEEMPIDALGDTEHGGPGAGRVLICQRCPSPNLRTTLRLAWACKTNGWWRRASHHDR
jgi:hypothetical protein